MQPSEDELRDLTVALHTVGRRLKRLSMRDPIDTAALAVLWRVAEHGELRPSDAAGELGLDLSTISRHVRSLADSGYLERMPDPGDRRACRLRVTPAGTQVVEEAWGRRLQAVVAAVADWPESDCAALTRLLGRLAEDMDAQAPHAHTREVNGERTTRRS